MSQTSEQNVAPNSRSLVGWRISDTSNPGSAGNFVLLPDGAHGAAEFSLTSIGEPPAKEIYSPAISVTPGKTYTFSAWVDNSRITRCWTYLWISSAARNQIYATAKLPPGQAGRYGFNARIPNETARIVFGFYTGGCPLPQGQKIVFSQPIVTRAQR